MSQCKVSVIIPVYNLERDIQTCLQCFSRQTLRDIEILCVDDGSTDASVRIIQSMQAQDNRIQLYQQHHQYAGAARNLGLSHAQGKYVYFFDGDDVCKPDLLETVYQKAEAVDADVIIFDFYQLDVEAGCQILGKAVREVHQPFIRGKKTFCYRDIPWYISELTTPAPWNKFFRRDYLERAGLQFSSLRSSEDLSFGRLSMICAERIACVERPLMTYHYVREGKQSLSSKAAGWWQDVIEAELEMYQKARLLPQYEEILPSLQLSCWTNLRWFFHQHFPDVSVPDAQVYKQEAERLFATLPLFDAMNPKTIRPDAYAEVQRARGNSQAGYSFHMQRQSTNDASDLMVYGVGAHLYDVLAWYPSLTRHIARLFDKDSNKIGTEAAYLGCKIEAPDALAGLPEGTKIAISAIRYYDEISRELRQINPGLRFITIDEACESAADELKAGRS